MQQVRSGAIVTTADNAIMQNGEGFSRGLFTSFTSYLDRGPRTTETYLTSLKQFGAWLSYESIVQPMRQDIIEYRDWLSTEHEAIEAEQSERGWRYRRDASGNIMTTICKPATIRLYLQCVKALFKWASSCGLYPDIASQVHAPKVRGDIHKRDAFTASEVMDIEQAIETKSAEKLLSQTKYRKDTKGRIQRADEQGKRLFAIFSLAVNAGLRTIEISRANIRDIEVKGGQASITIWGKGHSEADQRKPIAHEVYEAIKDYLSSRTDRPTPSSPLFVSTGNRSKGKRIASTTISKMLKKAMREAGFDSERLSAHSLRHTTGTAVQQLTNDLFKTQKYMRHTNPATTEIYLHNETEKQEAGIAEQLYDFYHGRKRDTETETREDLEKMLHKLTPEQMKHLKAYVASL